MMPDHQVSFASAIVLATLIGVFWPTDTRCVCAAAEDAVAASPAVLRAYEQHALTHDGDPQRGRELFVDEKLTKCGVCHKIGGQGGDAGPDLSAIGGKFGRPHLIESLLEPSRQIVEGYRTSVIVKTSGQVLTGIAKEQPDGSLSIVDGDGKRHTVPTADIDARRDSAVSLMPLGLERTVTHEQFTDLIAYLESLRPDGKAPPGSGVSGGIVLPAGFQVQIVATGLTGATALETSRDGRVFICEQTGQLRVVKDGKLLPDAALSLGVEAYWERGLIGVTVDPDFPRTPHIYVCYVARSPYPHHRISRFTMRGDVADPASERLLLQGDDQTKLGGKVPAGHQGGALHFGVDGKLYIGIGEQTSEKPSQDLGSLLGKLLRINADGSIPTDNPFVGQTQGKYRAIWARGLRNPFTFAIRKTSGDMGINDIGGNKFEEINRGVAGANYGWPFSEGPTTDERFVGPIHSYPNASVCGADFVADDSPWPTAYRGKYVFAEYIHGWIKMLDVNDPANVETFATGLRNPVDLRFAADGSLYVLLRNAWVIDAKFQPGTGTLLRIAYAQASQAEAQKKAVTLTEDAVDESAGNLPAYKIETPRATYFLEKTGAGLSSMIDRDGNDWLGFHPEPGSGAGGEYRGFPNAVHQQAGSYFHPKNTGTDPSTTKVESVAAERVTISAESSNGLWACRYDFFPTHCAFTMTRMPADKKYWVLYEGVPGGQYDEDDWWMTSAVKQPQPLTKRHDGDIPAPEWIAFGDKRLKRALYLMHHKDDDHPDTFYQMQQKMTVFGFGRRGLEKFQTTVPQTFTIGFVESVDHEPIGREALSLPKTSPDRPREGFQ
jgi:putative heme-binding domain-containing protein